MPETLGALPCESLAFNDSFPYSDDFINHDWTLFAGENPACGDTRIPVPNSPFGTNAYGINYSNSCGFGYVNTMGRDFSLVSRGSLFFKINTSVVTAATAITFRIEIKDLPGSGAFNDGLLIEQGEGGDSTDIHVTNKWGGDDCTISKTTAAQDYEWTIVIDIDDNLYSVYLNGSSAGCNNRQLTDDAHTATFDNINLYQTQDTGANNQQYMDDMVLCTSIGSTVCDTGFPIAFCDDFNYESAMLNEGWNVKLGGSSINSTFAPIDNQLNLTQDLIFLAPQHGIDSFPTSYNIDSGTVVTQSINAPVFSTEFDIQVTEGGFRYSVADAADNFIYILRGVMESNGSVSLSYANTLTTPLTYISICSNCTDNSTLQAIKTNIFFDNDECSYNYNSSVKDDHWDIYINDVVVGTNLTFLESSACNVNDAEIIKDVENKFVVDNYYVTVGTDKVVDTSTNFFTQLFDNVTIFTPTVIAGVEDDLATDIENIWVTFNLRTALSRAIAGLLLMFVVAVVFIMTLAASNNLNAAALGGVLLIEFLLMILLTIIRLLPIWIPFIITIVGGIGGFIIVKNMMSGGG